jgi:hypothetical protein
MEYQLTKATLENRPIRYELWIYEDAMINGAVQIGSKKVSQKIPVNSNSSADILEHISPEDWQAGKAVIAGVRDFQVGDVEEITRTETTQSGEEIISTGQIMVYVSNTKSIMFIASEYTGTVPNITVDQDVINNINTQSKGEIGILSIIDGVMILWR